MFELILLFGSVLIRFIKSDTLFIIGFAVIVGGAELAVDDESGFLENVSFNLEKNDLLGWEEEGAELWGTVAEDGTDVELWGTVAEDGTDADETLIGGAVANDCLDFVLLTDGTVICGE